MGVVQNGIEKVLKDAPRMVLASVVETKLEERGVHDAQIVDRITDAILAAGEEVDELELDVDLPFDVEFTDLDNERLRDAIARVTDCIPGLLDSISRNVGRELAEDCRTRWDAQSKVEAAERDKLCSRIAGRWGEGFAELRLLIELCSGTGDEFNRGRTRSRLKRNALRNEVLSRLHIRACRIANEIALLLENGFAEGALARWRTMFEVCVTAILIAEGGDALAQRYLDHEAADQKRVIDDQERAAAFSGIDRVGAAERAQVERDLAQMIGKYGSAFRGMYGWASGQLGLGDNPQFHNLLELAGVLGTKMHFRLACFGTHASPRMLSQPMHRWDPTLHVAGVFAAGFEIPGTLTASTLLQITSLMFGEPWDMDALVEARMLLTLRDDIEEKLFATARRIERDERRSIERASRISGHKIGIGRRRAGR